jgi:hypothetical protein
MPQSNSPDAQRLRRYRRCPECGVVRAASEFRRVGGVAGGPAFGPSERQRRRCPQCDFVGPLAAFPIAERPESNHGEAC